jgi:hypothetical protein
MIGDPPFDENGYLPPGIHRATLDEIRSRFGTATEVRQVKMESLQWLMDLLKQISVERVVLNGSWVRDDSEPIDVDCVVLVGADWGRQPDLEAEVEDRLPYITPQIAHQRLFDQYTKHIFASDRADRAKGMIEVIL